MNSTNGSENPLRYKVLLVGDGGVGKTQFIRATLSAPFDTTYRPTTYKNHDCTIHTCTFRTSKGDVIIDMWDLPGQENFSDLMPKWFKNTDAVILMFDVTSRLSYRNCPNWYRDIFREVYPCPIILVGNKVDVAERTVLPRHVLFHRKKSIEYFEISAKTRYNIENSWLHLIRQLRSYTDLIITETIGKYEEPEPNIDSSSSSHDDQIAARSSANGEEEPKKDEAAKLSFGGFEPFGGFGGFKPFGAVDAFGTKSTTAEPASTQPIIPFHFLNLQEMQFESYSQKFIHHPTGFTLILYDAFLMCRCPALLENQTFQSLASFDTNIETIKQLFVYIYGDKYSYSSSSFIGLIQLARLCKLESFEQFLLDSHLHQNLSELSHHEKIETLRKLLINISETNLSFILRVIRRTNLLDSEALISLLVDLLVDDTSKLKLAMSQVNSSNVTQALLLEPFGNLSSQLAAICPTNDLRNPPYSDFIILANDGSSLYELHCHRWMLASRVSYLSHLGSANLKNQSNQLKINSSHNAVLGLLQFIYTGIVPLSTLNSEQTCWNLLTKIDWKLEQQIEFEPLIKHCQKSTRFHPDSTYDVFQLLSECEKEGSEQTQKAIILFSKQLPIIMHDVKLRKQFDALPIATQNRILKQPYQSVDRL